MVITITITIIQIWYHYPWCVALLQECDYSSLIARECDTVALLFYTFSIIVDHLSSKLGADSNVTSAFDLIISKFLGNHQRQSFISESNLLSCGLVYYDLHDNAHFLFNEACSSIVLDILYPVVKSNYSLFSNYSKGGAEELLFSQSIMTTGIEIVCYGKGYFLLLTIYHYYIDKFNICILCVCKPIMSM